MTHPSRASIKEEPVHFFFESTSAHFCMLQFQFYLRPEAARLQAFLAASQSSAFHLDFSQCPQESLSRFSLHDPHSSESNGTVAAKQCGQTGRCWSRDGLHVHMAILCIPWLHKPSSEAKVALSPRRRLYCTSIFLALLSCMLLMYLHYLLSSTCLGTPFFSSIPVSMLFESHSRRRTVVVWSDASAQQTESGSVERQTARITRKCGTLLVRLSRTWGLAFTSAVRAGLFCGGGVRIFKSPCPPLYP